MSDGPPDENDLYDAAASETNDASVAIDYERKFKVARNAIDAGFAVLVAVVWPKPDGTVNKAPLYIHGHLDAHRDTQRIYQELIDPPVRWRPAGPFEIVVGFVPGSGNCGVLDCDVKHGKGGELAYRSLVRDHGQFAYSAWKSPSKGVNILFRKPAGANYSNASPWPGIDIRADNGWVVAPGNQTPWGNWAWATDMDYTTAQLLPTAMAQQLQPAALHGPKASNQQTIDFIEASVANATGHPQMLFGQTQLPKLRGAIKDSRHETLKAIMGWAFGMEHLDLRWAISETKKVWLELMESTNETGREDEVMEVATWVVGQEINKRSTQTQPQQLKPSGGETANDSQLTSLIVWKQAPDPFIIPRLEWLIEGFWPLQSYGELAGGEKSLKSTLATIIDVALAGGVPVLKRFAVPKPQTVLHFSAEGGETDYWRRFGRVSDAYGLKTSEVRSNLFVNFVASSILNPQFIQEIKEALDKFQPGLVHMDPWYMFAPPTVDSRQLTEIGGALGVIGNLCQRGGAALIINNHFNQTGLTNGLTRITGAGHAEWCDSWLLTKHREAPTPIMVASGNFKLRLDVGSRQWGGTSWDIDISLGRIDPMSGQHVGSIDWNIAPAGTAGNQTATPQMGHEANITKARGNLINTAGKYPGPFTQRELFDATAGGTAIKRAAFDRLISDGVFIATIKEVQSGKGARYVEAYETKLRPTTPHRASTAPRP